MKDVESTEEATFGWLGRQKPTDLCKFIVKDRVTGPVMNRVFGGNKVGWSVQGSATSYLLMENT